MTQKKLDFLKRSGPAAASRYRSARLFVKTVLLFFVLETRPMTNRIIRQLPHVGLTLLVTLCAATVAFAQAPSAKSAQKKSGQPQQPAATLAVTKQSASKPTAAKASTAKKAEPAVNARGLVEQHLAKNPYYAPGFLISRRDVEGLFAKLLELGITSSDDQEDLSESVLPDSSPLASRLKTPAGRAFMKKLAADPSIYHRLERLSWTPDGRQMIESFISGKDGVAKLQQLQTAEQLAKVSKRFAADPHTADFALPTNRAHTADELIAKLEELLAAKNAAE